MPNSGLNLTGLNMTRKVIQIIENLQTDDMYSSLTCLCDDGTVWRYSDYDGEWRNRTPSNQVPQTEIKNR